MKNLSRQIEKLCDHIYGFLTPLMQEESGLIHSARKKLIYLGLAMIGVYYYVTVGKWFWRKSTFCIYQKSKKVILCPVCGSDTPEFGCSIPILKSLSLFDKRILARKVYTLYWIPGGIIKNYLRKWEHFAIWPKKATIDYYRCNLCKVYFQNTPIEQKDRLDYFRFFYRDAACFGRPKNYRSGSRHHLWADYLKNLTVFDKGARILDVGCAEGFLVHRLNEMGYEAYGIDPAAPMIRYGKEVLGMDNLMVGQYNVESYPKKFFDLITSYHLFEHIDDREAMLQAAFRHLKDGGFLVVSTPCADAADKELRSGIPAEKLKNIFCLDHIFLPSQKYLSRLLHKVGFVLLGCQIIGRESLLPNRGVADSGEKWLGINIVARKYGQ